MVAGHDQTKRRQPPAKPARRVGARENPEVLRPSVIERNVWALVVAVCTRKLDFCFRSRQRGKAVLSEAFVAEPAIKALDMGVLRGFSGLDKVELYSTALRPPTKGYRDKFRPVVDTK